MIGFLVPCIFIISIWYMIEANAFLREVRQSSEDKKYDMSFFTHSGRWYLIQIIFGFKEIPASLMSSGQDRVLRLRISSALGILAFAAFLYLVKDAR